MDTLLHTKVNFQAGFNQVAWWPHFRLLTRKFLETALMVQVPNDSTLD